MRAAKKVLSIPVENTVYVSKDGNDLTGNGSFTQPFLTIAAAMASIVTASPTNRFSIMLMPGTYTENVVFKANVFIVGTVYNSSRIIGDTSIDASFTPAGDHRSGYSNVFVSGTVTLNFAAVSSNEGKFFCTNTRFGNGFVATAFSAINQLLIYDSEIFGNSTLNGMNTFLINCIILNLGSITGNHAPGTANSLAISGGSWFNLTLNGAAGAYTAFLYGNVQDTAALVINGPNVSVFSSSTSLPLLSLISFIGGATAAQITRINDAFGVGYIPSNPANWAGNPNNAQDALNRIAAAMAGLLGGPIP